MNEYVVDNSDFSVSSLIARGSDTPILIRENRSAVAVILSLSKFEALVTAEEDLEDLATIATASNDESADIPWETIKNELKLG